MIDAELDRLLDQLLGLGIVGLAIDAGQRHAAEADCANFEALLAERAMGKLGHFLSSLNWRPKGLAHYPILLPFECFDEARKIFTERSKIFR